MATLSCHFFKANAGDIALWQSLPFQESAFYGPDASEYWGDWDKLPEGSRLWIELQKESEFRTYFTENNTVMVVFDLPRDGSYLIVTAPLDLLQHDASQLIVTPPPDQLT